MISVTIRKVLFIMRWGNKIPEEWTEGRKDLQKQWKQKTLKGKGHWSLVDWWGLGPQNLDRRGKKSFLINANQGNELQCVCLWHQQDSLFPWSHHLACLSYPILHPNPPSFHPRWEVFCLSPYPETGPWDGKKHAAWWAKRYCHLSTPAFKDRNDKWGAEPLLLVQIKYALKIGRMHTHHSHSWPPIYQLSPSANSPQLPMARYWFIL